MTGVKQDMRYILWDWDGTLCLQQYFWPKSIFSDKEVNKLSGIWVRKEKSTKWLRGQETLNELCTQFDCKLSYERLAALLIEEWPDESTINMPLYSAISAIYPHAKHLIVTDNMDIFNDYARGSEFISKNIDRIFNSFNYGKCKPDADSLFNAVSASYDLKNFNACLLIDDSKDACDTFLRLGGNVINVTRNPRT